MRLLVLLLIGAIGAGVSAWGLPRGGRAARVGVIVGLVALLGVTGMAFLLRPIRLTTGQPITGIFGAHLVASEYLRLVVGLWALEGLVLVFIAWQLGGIARIRGLLPATLAAITGGTVAMSSADLGVGAAAAAATGLASLFVVLAAEGPAAVAAAARELRVTLGTGAVLLAAIAVVPVAARLVDIASAVGADTAAATTRGVAAPVLGLITLAVGLAVAARWGMLPFHVRVSRLTDLVAPESLPLLLAWIAVPMTIVAFAAIDRLMPLPLPLDGERIVLILLAVVTLVGASLAAFFHDDLRHAVGYLVVGDAGLLLLAIAALDPEAWGPARAWIVALAASKTALGAWAAVAETRFESRSVPELRGWLRRSPLLAVAFVLTVLATFGLPGWVAFEARATLATFVAAAPWNGMLVLAGFLTLPTYLRLIVVGSGRVTSHVDRATPEWFVRRRRVPELLPVELEGSAVVAAPGRAAGGPRPGSPAGARSAAMPGPTVADRTRVIAADAGASMRAATVSVRTMLARGPRPAVEDTAADGLTQGAWRSGARRTRGQQAGGVGARFPWPDAVDRGGRRPGAGRRRPGPASRPGHRSAVGRRLGDARRRAADHEPAAEQDRAALGCGARPRDPRRAHELGRAGPRARRRGAGPDPRGPDDRLTGGPGRSPAGRAVRSPELLRGGEHPAVDVALVRQQLLGTEPEVELGRRVLGAVRRVDQVLRGLDREVAADGSRGRLVGTGRAVHRADDRDGVRSLERGRHERAGRDERDEAGEEGLVAVDRVVLLGQGAVDVHELEADELEAALLEPREHATDELALDAVGLDEEQGALEIRHGLGPRVSRGRCRARRDRAGCSGGCTG